MEGCKKAINDFNEILVHDWYQSVGQGCGLIRHGITDCTIPYRPVTEELEDGLDVCGFLNGKKGDYIRNLTPEAVETFKNAQEEVNDG